MGILNYTTTISVEKTVSEVQKILACHGANKIITDYDGEFPSGITFHLTKKERVFAYMLPANYKGVLVAMDKDKSVPKKYVKHNHARKVTWRIVKDWVEAQMALIDAELADITEVFMPYMITRHGTTLYEEIDNLNNLLPEHAE